MTSAEETFAGTARFEIVRRIGGGGMGIVYEAIDRETNEHVALKVLRSMSAEALLLFKNEFRALADIEHPNLVSLGELFEEHGQWFFTMELVRGQHFLAYVGAPPEEGPDTLPAQVGEEDSTIDSGGENAAAAQLRRSIAVEQLARERRAREADTRRDRDSVPEIPLIAIERSASARRAVAHAGPDLTKLRAALGQLARGLSALHEANKVHRDIKPSNILVTPEGRVVILDFGVITEATDHVADSEAQLVGTIAYMAPEQVAAERVGPEADWYSVGVVLYQSLTGRLPVRGPALEVALLKRVVEPPPPSVFSHDVPIDLDQLCVDLLHIDAKMRPAGVELMRRVGAEGRDRSSFPAPAPRFVGREAETARLRAAFDETSNGAAITVLVRGESGVGKTALVRRFAESVAASDGALVLKSRCYERESVPYKAIDGAVDALSRYLAALPPKEAAALLPPHAGLLGHVFPVLRKQDTIARLVPRALGEGPYAGMDKHAIRAHLFAALRELLARIAARRKLVLCIDDLQWADADGLALLAEIMRPPCAPILLIGTVRAALATESRRPAELGGAEGARVSRPPPHEEHGGATPTARPIASAIPGEVRELALESLDAEGARSLAAALLGEGGEAADVVAIATEARGHPLFIDELVRGRLAHLEERAPLRLEDALWGRIARLDPPVRRLLQLLVVAGAPIAQEALARAADIELGELAKHAASLRAANLARTLGPRRTDAIEPYHDRIRAAVLEHTPPSERRDHHARLASALVASASADPEALAVHFREAGDAKRAAEHAERAADQAARALAFDRAARLYRMALDAAGESADALRARRPLDLAQHESEARGALFAKLGDALANAGRGAEAAEAFLAAAPLVTGATAAIDLRRRAAEELLHSGHVDDALAAFDEVLSAVNLYSPRSPNGALALLLARRAELRLRGLSFDERDEGDLPPEPLTRIDACWAVGMGLGLVDAIRGSYFQVRALLLALEAGEPRRVARSLAGEVCFSSADGGRSKKRTARLLAQAEALSGKLGDPYGTAWTRGAAGIAATLEGRWATAHEACDEAEALFREGCTGVVWEIGTMRWFGLWALAYMGRVAEVATRVTSGLHEAEGRGDLYATVCQSTGLPTLTWLAEDDANGARERCREALERWSQKTFHVEHWWAMLAERQIDLYAGKGHDAFLAILGTWSRLSSTLLLRVQLTELEALHLRARAALAAAGERGADIRALCRAALADARKIRRASMPWSNPLADLLEAGAHFRQGEIDRAHTLLGSAAASLDGADMALYAAAARYRLGSIEGGDGGRELVADAERFMASEGIRKPDRMTAMLAPGFD